MQATENAVTVFFIDYVFSQMGVFIISIFFPRGGQILITVDGIVVTIVWGTRVKNQMRVITDKKWKTMLPHFLIIFSWKVPLYQSPSVSLFELDKSKYIFWDQNIYTNVSNIMSSDM